jgi:hypothetical protein
MAWKSVVVAGLLAQSSLVAAQDQQAIAIAPAPGWAALSEPLEVPADTQGLTFLRREDQLEAAMLDGLLTAVLRVPDLRVGDDLEIAYTVPLHGDRPRQGRARQQATGRLRQFDGDPELQPRRGRRAVDRR